jgi:methyl-accepting chemotaxis protein
MNIEVLLANVVILPIVFIIMLSVFYYRYKMKRKSLEFRVTLFITISFIILAEVIIVVIGHIDSSITFLPFIVYPIGFIVLSTGLDYTIKQILKQQAIVEDKNNDLLSVFNVTSETSMNVSNNATELATSANEVNSSAEEIAATTMEITMKAKSQAESLMQINKEAQNIKEIADIVKKISEQTNLLALNASIEAGRAGDQGRGFAVVAERVQKLAEEAKNSVEKTADIVEKISKDIEKATADSFDISRAMEEISTAAEEQTASMEEITATSGFLGEEAESLKEQLSYFRK